MGKCVYSRDWPKRYPWVKETDNKHKAHCRACNKDIDVAQMGKSALRSQASGDRHKKHEQSLSGTFTNFFIKEIKVKTETSTTASTQSDNTSDNIMIPPPPKASVAGPSVSIIDKYV